MFGAGACRPRGKTARRLNDAEGKTILTLYELDMNFSALAQKKSRAKNVTKEFALVTMTTESGVSAVASRFRAAGSRVVEQKK